MKMHKNCFHQSCSFWLRYAPAGAQTGGAYSTLPDSLAGLGNGAPGKGKKGGEKEVVVWSEGMGGDRVPECPNPVLASLMCSDAVISHTPPICRVYSTVQ